MQQEEELNNNRFTRYASIVDPEALQSAGATVVGVGAIGRQVALMLTSMGIGHLQLFDPDTVEPINLGAQGYAPRSVGDAKVDAAAGDARLTQPNIAIEQHQKAFQIGDAQHPAVFCCVDSMKARQQVHRAAKMHAADIFIDGRMSLFSMRVLHWRLPSDQDLIAMYEQTLIDDADTEQAPCTAKTTLFTATICAGLMVNRYFQWLRNPDLPMQSDFSMGLLG